MDIHTFISNYQEAFGMQAELPITFWYSDRLEAPTEKINGCLFKCIKLVREGKTVSLNAETMGCGGGKFYTGFTEMPEHVPNFVSLKEKYKRTPEMVTDFIREIQVPKAKKNYLHFARIDRISSFDDVEGILFLATPDILSGLATWAYYDNNAPDAVSSPFGSGCLFCCDPNDSRKSKARKTYFLRILRSVCPSLFRSRHIKFCCSDVTIQSDVPHNARKLPVRYACVGKG